MGFATKLSCSCLIICLNLPLTTYADGLPTSPLRVRNMSPVVQLYGIPRALGPEISSESWELGLNAEISNNFQSSVNEGTFAFFDGETYVTTLSLRTALSDRFEWGLEVPWVRHAPGNFDGLIDEFHHLFGFPDGNRDIAPRNRLDYLIRSDGQVYADFDSVVNDLGDIRGVVGMQVFNDQRGALAMRTQVKLPTGSVEELSGSEGIDIAVWSEYGYAVPVADRYVRLTIAGGLSYLEDGELIPEDQQNWVPFGHLGLQIPIHSRIDFHAQLDAHGQILDTSNPLVADGGVLGTLGGRIGVTPRSWLDLAIIEDLHNDSASDVIFQIMLGAEF